MKDKQKLRAGALAIVMWVASLLDLDRMMGHRETDSHVHIAVRFLEMGLSLTLALMCTVQWRKLRIAARAEANR